MTNSYYYWIEHLMIYYTMIRYAMLWHDLIQYIVGASEQAEVSGSERNQRLVAPRDKKAKRGQLFIVSVRFVREKHKQSLLYCID